MNYVLTSSRGKDIPLSGLPEGTQLIVRFGGRLRELRSEAEDFLSPSFGPIRRRNHIYFLCGIPDITTILKNDTPKYRECIYSEDPQVTIKRYTSEL